MDPNARPTTNQSLSPGDGDDAFKLAEGLFLESAQLICDLPMEGCPPNLIRNTEGLLKELIRRKKGKEQAEKLRQLGDRIVSAVRAGDVEQFKELAGQVVGSPVTNPELASSSSSASGQRSALEGSGNRRR